MILLKIINNFRKSQVDKQPLVNQINCHLINQPTVCRSLQKQISRDPAGGGGPGVATSNPSTITLDSIITEYLTNQHALCKNPMVTCPQFNLFEYVLFILLYNYITCVITLM